MELSGKTSFDGSIKLVKNELKYKGPPLVAANKSLFGMEDILRMIHKNTPLERRFKFG